MTKIQIEKENDIQLLKAIARTGLITEDLLHYSNINFKRLKQHIDSKTIVKKGTYLLYGVLTNIYILSEDSKHRLRSDFLIDLYKSDTTQLEHDYTLSKIYSNLTIKERNTWKTETELHSLYDAPTTADGLYIANSGKKIGVEVITSSYSKGEIELKKDFIRQHCDDFIMIHTHRNINYTI